MQGSYETIMVLNTKLDEEASQALVAKFTDMINAAGHVDTVDDWGKRRLAYEIEDETEGHYVLITFTADHELIAELNRVYSITDGLLRTMVVRKDK